MPIIKHFPLFLEQQVAQSERGYDYTLGTPIVPEYQRGQICKLHALHVACNSLHQSYGTPKPIPLRKDKNPQNFFSMREVAKVVYGSKVGEVYSAKTLVSLAEDNGYKATVYSATQADDYFAKVISAIHNGDVPVLFYDIDINNEPIFAQGNREHAVVVAGYYRNKQNELGFIISQHGNYYWEKAEYVYQSANQLSVNRAPETFDKHGKNWIDMYTKRILPATSFLLAEPAGERRQALPLEQNDGGLKSKILIVHKQPKNINTHSFWNNGLTTTESNRLFTQYLHRENIVPIDRGANNYLKTM